MPLTPTLDEADVAHKRVLVRVDLNVPIENGAITDMTRVHHVLPTIRTLQQRQAKVILLAHFGRPKGSRKSEDSLRPLQGALSEALSSPVAFADDCIGEDAQKAVAALKGGDVLLLENTRFHKGEEANDPAFADALAKLGDIYVNDAFSAAHRAHASTEGLAHRLPAFAGYGMAAELKALAAALEAPKRPVIALVGGAKISTKIDLLMNLLAKVDTLVIGGGMANTFLAAQGVNVGRSLCEHDLGETARAILQQANTLGAKILLPTDAVTAREFKAGAENQILAVDAVPDDAMILDLGPDSVATINAAIDKAATLLWNGPLGAFEIPPFDAATVAVARHAATRTREGKLLSVAGGGDTVAALNHAGVTAAFTYVSTAGGAFLEWLEGKTLPGVAALQRSQA